MKFVELFQIKLTELLFQSLTNKKVKLSIDTNGDLVALKDGEPDPIILTTAKSGGFKVGSAVYDSGLKKLNLSNGNLFDVYNTGDIDLISTTGFKDGDEIQLNFKQTINGSIKRNINGFFSKELIGTDNYITNVFTLTNNTIIAINLTSNIVKSVDNGLNWTSLRSNLQILKIIKISDLIWYSIEAGEDSIKLYKTINGGTSFTFVSNFSADYPLVWNATYFVNENIGYGFGEDQSVILKTIDGGLTWTPLVHNNIFINIVEACYFSDENTGFVGVGKKIYKTIDGGLTWSEIFSDTLNKLGFKYFKKIGTKLFFIGSNGLVYSFDNGLTWTPFHMTKNVTTTLIIYDIEFVDDNIGYFGTDVSIWKTIDGGVSWVQLNDPRLNGFMFYSIVKTDTIYFFDLDKRLKLPGVTDAIFLSDNKNSIKLADIDYKLTLIYLNGYWYENGDNSKIPAQDIDLTINKLKILPSIGTYIDYPSTSNELETGYLSVIDGDIVFVDMPILRAIERPKNDKTNILTICFVSDCEFGLPGSGRTNFISCSFIKKRIIKGNSIIQFIFDRDAFYWKEIESKDNFKLTNGNNPSYDEYEKILGLSQSDYQYRLTNKPGLDFDIETIERAASKTGDIIKLIIENNTCKITQTPTGNIKTINGVPIKINEIGSNGGNTFTCIEFCYSNNYWWQISTPSRIYGIYEDFTSVDNSLRLAPGFNDYKIIGLTAQLNTILRLNSTLNDIVKLSIIGPGVVNKTAITGMTENLTLLENESVEITIRRGATDTEWYLVRTSLTKDGGSSGFAYNLVYAGNVDIYMSFVTNVSLSAFNNISGIAKSYICTNGVDFVELVAGILPIAIVKDTLVVFRIEYLPESQNAILNITGTNN